MRILLSAGGSIGGGERTGTAAQPADGSEAGDPFDPDDNGPYQVHGVAVPEDGLTFGKDEEWTFWPEQVARDAEGSLQGRNIVDLHPEEPTNDDVIGEVTGERYIAGLGLAWSGEVDSRKRAKQIHRGRLDSSPYLYATDGGDPSNLPADAPDDVRVASEITKIRDIGMVPDGAIEGSEVSPGPHPGIESESGVATALSKGFSAETGESEGSFNSGDNQSGFMSDNSDGGSGGDGGADPSIEDLRSKIDSLESENENLKSELQVLRQPYIQAVTDGTDLEPEQVNMDAEDLAAYFENNEGEGGGEEDGEASAQGADAGSAESGEEATALSAAPLTAARGSPAGKEGSATALSEGEGDGSDGSSKSVETPDESAETLKERRRIMGSRGTEEYREKLDAQIEAAEQAEGN